MMSRCYNLNSRSHKWYGAKGVRVAPEWHDVKTFFDWALANGYKDDLTIERVKVYGDYEPSNCEWIPSEEQPHNTTVSVGVKNALEIREAIKNGAKPKELAIKYGVAYQTIISIKNKDNYPNI